MPVPAILASMLNSVVGNAVNTAMENAVYAPPEPTDVAVVGARAFPEGTRKGDMEPLQHGTQEVIISGKSYPRSLGMQIRSQQNLIIMPTAIQSKVPVRFQLDGSGAVFRVWVLTRNEVATP